MAEPLLIQARYRNKLERQIGEQLNAAGVSFDYEPRNVDYTVPARKAKYLPDFWPKDQETGKPLKIIIESKGYFWDSARDRQKLILVRESNPELDVRIVFSDASKPIYKGSKTSYGAWATANGFTWADHGIVPPAWIKEMKVKCERPAKR